MSDFARRIAAASAHAEPEWSPERETRLRAGVSRSLERGRRRRVTLVVATGACTLLVGFFLGRLQSPEHVRMALSSATAPSLVELPDGSQVSAVATGTRVETVGVSPENVTLRLDSGTARFSVTPNPRRPFRVLAR